MENDGTKYNQPNKISENSTKNSVYRSEKLWIGLRWTSFIIAVLFVGGYVGFVFFGMTFQDSYPATFAKIAAYIHIVPSIGIILLSPLQFFPTIRQNHIIIHKIFGYSVIVFTNIAIIGIIMICIGYAEGGPPAELSGIVIGLYWVFSLWVGWRRIREKNIQAHREWMIRFFTLAYAIIIMRIFIVIFISIFNWTKNVAIGATLPTVWSITIILTEFYLYKTRINYIKNEIVLNGQVFATFNKNYVSVNLINKVRISPNTSVFTFSLPHPCMKLLMLGGNHVLFKCKIGKKTVIRPYSPLNSEVLGIIEFAIKRYEYGKMSKYLHDDLSIGQSIEIKGPIGHYQYKSNEYETVVMIAGGTGITPILSIINTIINNPMDNTKIRLLYSNVDEQDILFVDYFDQIADKYRDRFEVYHTISRVNNQAGTRPYDIGRINKEMLQKYVPLQPNKTTKILICGPHPMNITIMNLLRQLSYPLNSVYCFGLSDR